jgi:predicted kinase
MAKSSTRLVLICGLPASGKSTLARRLAPKIPAIRLDKDGWVTQLGADVWDDEFRVRLERQLWALTQELLARGQSVILEWGHWARAERDEKRLGARALGVGVELHYLDGPLQELIERAERRNASGEWTASPMTRTHFKQWATIFQPPEEEELLLFDEPDPEAWFHEVITASVNIVTEVPGAGDIALDPDLEASPLRFKQPPRS